MNKSSASLLDRIRYRMPAVPQPSHRLALLLSLAVLFDGSLVLYRNLYLADLWENIYGLVGLVKEETGKTFFFLLWNLFLAWVPYGISLSIKKDQAPLTKYVLLLGWLVFFPNAPYIITDFLHLRPRFPVPLWYDLLMIFSFAWTGLIFGYLSMIRVQRVLNESFGLWWSRLVIGGVWILTGLGIYIGRFLRWNTWDILAQPRTLLIDLFSIITDFHVHWPALGAGILLSAMLYLNYYILRAMGSR